MLHVDWKTWRCAQCAWMPSEATDNIQAENAVKGHIAYHYASAPAGERATIWCSGCGTRCPFPEGFLLDGVVHLCGDCWRHVQPVLHRRQAPSVLAPVGESMIQRYDLVTNYRCGSTIEEMERSDDGEWVRWEAVQERIHALEADVAELESLREKMSSLLTRTANALKGEPDELKWHDWSDLPTVAARLTAERDEALQHIEKAREAIANAQQWADKWRDHAFAAKAERDEARAERDELLRDRMEPGGVSVCGHYRVFALPCVMEDGSEQPYCMQCDRDAAWDRVEKAEATIATLRETLRETQT